MAIATFCSSVNAVTAEAAQLGKDPPVPLPLAEKQLSAAVRHYTFVQRSYTDPARHGADIFAGPLGHCPPCAGALLAQGTGEVPEAVSAEEPVAPVPAGEGFVAGGGHSMYTRWFLVQCLGGWLDE